MRPQTIQIFLPDGSPRSIKIAEITNRVVKAILIPRNKLQEAGNRDEIKNVGLYFLFGEDADKARPVVYIGEAENCYDRLKQHNREKEFWNFAVAIISKINAFTKAHVKYLEYHAVKIAKEVKRFETENTTTPQKPYVMEHMEADLLDSFETIQILLSTLGYPVFDEIGKKAQKKKDIVFCKGKGILAEGEYIDEGFVVFKGSQAKKKTVPSCHDYLISLRNKLLDSLVLKEHDEEYVFQTDYIFNSPSTAGGVVLGRATNGWVAWKDKNGKTLDELKRQ